MRHRSFYCLQQGEEAYNAICTLAKEKFLTIGDLTCRGYDRQFPHMYINSGGCIISNSESYVSSTGLPGVSLQSFLKIVRDDALELQPFTSVYDVCIDSSESAYNQIISACKKNKIPFALSAEIYNASYPNLFWTGRCIDSLSNSDYVSDLNRFSLSDFLYKIELSGKQTSLSADQVTDPVPDACLTVPGVFSPTRLLKSRYAQVLADALADAPCVVIKPRRIGITSLFDSLPEIAKPKRRRL
jgi:hypothetical protein